MAASGKTTKTLVWILMGMLVLGLGGFGVTNLSGNLRIIGTVGDKDLDINQYARALQQDIRAIEAQTGQSLNFAQIQQFGVDSSVLNRVVASRALDFEASQLGLSIGDASLSRQILDIPNFQGIDGTFDREGYKFALSQQGITESEFEISLREETTRTLLQGAIVSGTAMPAIYGDTLMDYIGARRNFIWVRVDTIDDEITAPTDAEIATYHAENQAAFTLPEMKRLTYVWLSPDMLIDTVEVDETSLQELYKDRAGDFIQPERRLVERLVFADESAAETAKAAIEGDDSSFETLVEARGLSLSDIDLGDVTKDGLGDAGAAVFNADIGMVVGPFTSSLGPALFRVNGVLPARETTYEEALPQLRDVLAADRSRRVIEDQIEDVEDLLAGGATLEELAAETDMVLETQDWAAGSSEGPAAYTAFIAAATVVTTDDFPEVIQLDDGGIVALRLDDILAPRLQSVADVRAEIATAWTNAETDKRLAAQAEALATTIREGADITTLAAPSQTASNVLRTAHIDGTPADFITQVFEMEASEIKVMTAPGYAVIVRLDMVLGPDINDDELAPLLVQFQEQASSSISQDLYGVFAGDIRSRAGVSLDQRAINAVHANYQ